MTDIYTTTRANLTPNKSDLYKQCIQNVHRREPRPLYSTHFHHTDRVNPHKIFHISRRYGYWLLFIRLVFIRFRPCMCVCVRAPLTISKLWTFEPSLPLSITSVWERVSCLAETSPSLPITAPHCTAITLIKLTMCVGERVQCVCVRRRRGKGLSVSVYVYVWECVFVCVLWEWERHAVLAEFPPASKSVH